MVVPKSLMKTILQEMHEHFGHFGIGKTYSLIKRFYYWSKIIKPIQAHVDSCSLCQMGEASGWQGSAADHRDRPGWAFAKVSAEFDCGITYLSLQQADIYWWWWIISPDGPIAKAIPDKEATTVASAIFKKLVFEHGVHMKFFFLNNGKEFSNDTLAYVHQGFNI